MVSHPPEKKVWADRKCTTVLLMTQHLKALALARKQREKMEHNACVRLFEGGTLARENHACDCSLMERALGCRAGRQRSYHRPDIP